MGLKLDHITPEERSWPGAFNDLISLVSQGDENSQKSYVRLVVKTLQVFDEEIVERCEQKQMAEIELA